MMNESIICDKNDLATMANAVRARTGGVETYNVPELATAVTSIIENSGPGSVISVNGKTGNVLLTAADVGALPDTTEIPSIEGLATEEYVNTQINTVSTALIGNTSTLTPTQVKNAIEAGRDVLITHTTSEFGDIRCSYFSFVDELEALFTTVVAMYGGVLFACQLVGYFNADSWEFYTNILARSEDIPTTLPNPNALTFTGVATGVYDGTSALTINIPAIAGEKGDKGDTGTSITIENILMSPDDGGSNTITFSDGTVLTVKNGSKGNTGATGATGGMGPAGPAGPAGRDGDKGDKGDKGDTGATGQRGTGLLPVTTAPSTYTTAVNGLTPAYRIALSTVKSQASATEVFAGDTVRYSYYHYPVIYVDSSYVYCGTRVSIRGATGAAGTTPVKGTDYWTEADQESIVQQVIAALPDASEVSY